MHKRRDYFKKYIVKQDECWLWKGAINSGGYGCLTLNQKILMAHRACWESYFGDMPKGTCIAHMCPERTCINPMHLYLNYGSRSKLQLDEILEIRLIARDGLARGQAKKLGIRFGVTSCQIRHIVAKKCFKHL